MRYNMKIAITPAKLCYSICFMVILALIRGISDTSEIGVAMDPNVSLLAIIFCSDTFYQEVMGNRFEVFHLLPEASQCRTIIQRLFLQIAYIILLICLGYWIFYLQKPISLGSQNELLLYGSSVLACSVSALFFGTLSVTLVNFVRNLWVGIGGTFVVWIMMNSTLAKKLPDFLNIFNYGDSMGNTINYLTTGKITAVIITGLLLLLNDRILIPKTERIR